MYLERQNPFGSECIFEILSDGARTTENMIRQKARMESRASIEIHMSEEKIYDGTRMAICESLAVINVRLSWSISGRSAEEAAGRRRTWSSQEKIIKRQSSDQIRIRRIYGNRYAITIAIKRLPTWCHSGSTNLAVFRFQFFIRTGSALFV